MKKIHILPAYIEALTPGIIDVTAINDGDIGTYLFAGWKPENYPAKIQINLPESHTIFKMRIFDGAGNPALKVHFKNADGSKSTLVEVKLDFFNTWKEVQIYLHEIKTITIVLDSPQGSSPIGEFEFYGEPSIAQPGTPTPSQPKFKGLAAAIGTNGFDWCSDQALEPFAIVRCYQELGWTWQPNGIAVAPAYRDIDYDQWLLHQKGKGREVVWCANKMPHWYAQGDKKPGWQDRRLHRQNKDGEDPNSYRDIAGYYWQIAARYGRVQWDDLVLRCEHVPQYHNAPVTTKASGLNLLSWIEIENEPNRWWKPDWAQYTPQQFAAMLSACYDGHCGTMGPGLGIKNADATMNVAFGLADINISYLSAMLKWFKEHRQDGEFPADAVGVHHYCNAGNSKDNPQMHFTGQGVTPESDNLHQRLEKLTDWRDTHCPEVAELWLSEFGYDTNISSPHYASTMDAAAWIARTYLIALSAGMDKVMVYNAIDESDPTKGLFQSSGISHGKNQGQSPKPSYFTISKINQILNGMNSISIPDQPDGELKTSHCVMSDGSNLHFYAWAMDGTVELGQMPEKI